MYFHTVAYSASLAAGPNLDTAFAQDDVIMSRNSHMILTNRYNLITAVPIGALINRSRFGNASLQRYSFIHLHPLNVGALPLTNPQIMDLRDTPMELPMNEEITIESGNSAAGPTVTSAILNIATPEWTVNQPSILARITTRATATIVAGTTTTWGPLANITFERDLINGVYAVLGCSTVLATGLAFRLRFGDQQSVNGKQHRPGFINQSTHTLQPNPLWKDGFGEWGRFHTFSPPQVQMFGDAAGGAAELRLVLGYLGSDESLLNR